MQIDFKNNLVTPSCTLKSCISQLNDLELKILFVVNDDLKLIGTVTDGDIRRAILNGLNLETIIDKAMFSDFVKYYDEQSISKLENEILSNDLQAIPILNKDNTIKAVHAAGMHLKQSSKQNTVVLMAGGFGSRLRPLTDDCPKPLLKVGEKPIIEIIIENFIKYGFTNFIVSTHYMAQMIKDHLGDGSNLNCTIEYIEEKTPRGTAGCLSLIEKKSLSSHVFLMNADVLTNVNFKQLLDFHENTTASITMCVRDYTHQIPYGVVSSNNEYIESIEEKPTNTSKVSAGIYVINNKVLHKLNKGEHLDMPALISKEIKEKESSVVAFPIHEYWLDIGQIGDYKRAQVDFISNFLNHD